MNRTSKFLISALLLPCAALALSACVHQMGPNEKAGAKIDNAIGIDPPPGKDGPFENTGERIDNATGQNKDDNDSPKK